MDTRRKIQFYINPDRHSADKYVGEVLEKMPQGERGKFMPGAFLSGVALFKQEPRLIYTSFARAYKILEMASEQ
ncbi:plasmid partitioning/stability family protein [Arsenophonus sp. PmNCSU2021_1]|uniref:plasmid partitioning/stability family protein n=1 Tax=Arsenophonus sp. PmNCSU2021_1 TaxID=3118989 RepID=UPI002FF0C529